VSFGKLSEDDSGGEKMLEQAQSLRDTLTSLRRAIHQHPELGFQEVQTSHLVAETLASLGLKVDTEVGKTGVIGYLGQDGPTLAIRADMDALPIQEQNDVQYASRVPGIMHACGHDAHTAIALGVAMLLSEMELPGNVRFLFQPSEETSDEEGKSGAIRLVEEGAMAGVGAILALHVEPRLESGQIKVASGPICAAADSFKATILGKGCHGAFPHLGTDPIFISAQVINAVQSIVARRLDPTKPAVITIGSIHGGTASNIIPSQVDLRGTIRSLDEEHRQQAWIELERAFEVSRTLGGDFQLQIQKGYPVLVNDPAMAELVRQVATNLLGPDAVQIEEPEMGAEDFSVLADEAPGAMFSLGVKHKGSGEPHQLHSPHFEIDEAALPIGVAILAETALRYLSEKSR
jgi:amidohydrolase